MPSNPAVVTAAVLIIFTWLRYAQDLVVPFLLALFITVIATAPMSWMKRRGWPPALAVGSIFVGIILIELLMAALMGGSFHAFTQKLPEYQERLRGLADGVLTWLSGLGVDVSHGIIRRAVDPGSVMVFANHMVSSIGQGLSHTFLLMFTVLFMLTETWELPDKLATIGGERTRINAERLMAIIDSTKRYTSIKALMSAVTGLLIWAGTSAVGLDFSVLWGFLAFLLNFIPTIGSIIAAVPAVLLALVQLGPGWAAAVAGLYLAVNMVIGNFIEPRYLGRQVGLSTLVVFLSMVFWGWLLGPVGMLLSVPLTMVAKFAAEANERTRWLAVLLAPGRPAHAESQVREEV